MKFTHRFWQWFYDHVAFAYDAVLHAGARLNIGSEDLIRRKVIGKFYLADGMRVMEIGCGTASARAFLPKAVRYFGLDISRGMLGLAKTKCENSGLPADFVQADAEALPFINGCFGFNLIMGTMQHVEDPEAVFSEMQRVSTSAGQIVIIDETRSQRRIQASVADHPAQMSAFAEYFVIKWTSPYR
jgi:ubiquinone/menaquinone biosynthesis C-methylase UbiE